MRSLEQGSRLRRGATSSCSWSRAVQSRGIAPKELAVGSGTVRRGSSARPVGAFVVLIFLFLSVGGIHICSNFFLRLSRSALPMAQTGCFRWDGVAITATLARARGVGSASLRGRCAPTASAASPVPTPDAPCVRRCRSPPPPAAPARASRDALRPASSATTRWQSSGQRSCASPKCRPRLSSLRWRNRAIALETLDGWSGHRKAIFGAVFAFAGAG